MQRDISIAHQIMYEFDESISQASVGNGLRPVDTAAQRLLTSIVGVRVYPYPRNTTGSADLVWSEGYPLLGPIRRIRVTGEFQVRCDPSATASQAESPPTLQHTPPSWARRGSTIWNWARQVLPDTAPGRSDIDAFMELMRADLIVTDGAGLSATVPRFFRRRRGGLQDHLRLAAACLRARGVPVELVSGYLIREPPGGHRFEEAGQTHEWLSTWEPASGWRDVDPTTGLPPPHFHVTRQRGCRLADIRPVSMRLYGIATQPRPRVRETVIQTVVAS